MEDEINFIVDLNQELLLTNKTRPGWHKDAKERFLKGVEGDGWITGIYFPRTFNLYEFTNVLTD